jgi:type VI protein secretion system component Hcp
MSSARFAVTSRRAFRGVAALTLLGGAWGLAPASPAAAHVVAGQLPAPSSAFDVFLVLPATSGQSTSNGPTTNEQLSAFSLSSTAPTATGGGSTGAGAGEAFSLAPFIATMALDTTSSNLLHIAFYGRNLSLVEVDFDRSSAGKETTFFKYLFKNVTISSYQLQAAAGDTSVQIGFAFQEIAFSYVTGVSSSGATGAPPGGWNISTNKAV